ncbi:unnamed protein product [Cladocopium goreaui]|uniref:Uncharacterized protein n=1 Tax=Cladocopium goreaui TaxID=2562237 RepID=A0A9P1FMW2_9DINO|nr:unnamed protein product [Cladocopium goreaui]
MAAPHTLLAEEDGIEESPRPAPRVWPMCTVMTVVTLAALALLSQAPGHGLSGAAATRGMAEADAVAVQRLHSGCAMECTEGSVCCGGKECCMDGDSCCGGTCLSKGATCCRDSEDFPLMCTPDTYCCGKDTTIALCCTTGCKKSVFGSEMCEDLN